MVTMQTIDDSLQIRYTLDGTDPNPNSLLFTKPIPLNSSATVKAAAFQGSKRISLVSNSIWYKNKKK